MASRMRKRSSRRVASLDVITALRAPIVAMPASTVMIAITMTSSISVQPPFAAIRRAPHPVLPVRIFRPVEGDTGALAVHIVHVLAAPAGRVRLVLVGAHAPLGVVRHGVDRHA